MDNKGKYRTITHGLGHFCPNTAHKIFGIIGLKISRLLFLQALERPDIMAPKLRILLMGKSYPLSFQTLWPMVAELRQ